MGRRGAAARRAGQGPQPRSGTPREPALGAEALQVPAAPVKPFPARKESQGCKRGWPGRWVSSQSTRLRPGRVRGELLPRPGLGRGGLSPSLLPSAIKPRSFTQKLRDGVAGDFFFLKLFLNALLRRKMILRRGGPFSNYH